MEFEPFRYLHINMSLESYTEIIIMLNKNCKLFVKTINLNSKLITFHKCNQPIMNNKFKMFSKIESLVLITNPQKCLAFSVLKEIVHLNTFCIL